MSTTCTNHCSQCGRHFHSLNAFDAHHIHDDTGWPVCLDPIDLEDRDGKQRLEALTHDGECRIGGYNANGTPRSGSNITIWRLAISPTERKRLSQLPGSASRATSEAKA